VDTHFGVQRFEGVEESDNTKWTGGVLVDTKVKPLLTISGFHELENRNPCSEIYEITKCEVPK
jgi:hypothetical protein